MIFQLDQFQDFINDRLVKSEVVVGRWKFLMLIREDGDSVIC